ncbi:hypothetical protein GCM10009087_15580 [Sphingomonas oligophenolica]|uniref:Uncharacterized protein n=1 Tax=Sphingomonas oligophenolica TaxID=301154 RepID=A0ABU9YC05_9SPHN
MSVTIACLAGLVQAPRGAFTLIVALFFLSGVRLLFMAGLGEYGIAMHRNLGGGAVVVER